MAMTARLNTDERRRWKGTAASASFGVVLNFWLFIGASPAAAETYTLPDGRTVQTLEMFQECAVCPEMIVLPMGSFTMGAPLEQSEQLANTFPYNFEILSNPDMPRLEGLEQEGPEHEVIIDIPIAMGRNEITQDEWIACVDDGGCLPADPKMLAITGPGQTGWITLEGRHPVIHVSYLDILAYVDWLNGKVGAEVYRLPTEAEWEYAARAGTTTRFAQGDTLSPDQANFSRVGTERVQGVPRPELTNRGAPLPVDELDAANGWGLRHMSGNVRERTMSCWSERHLGLPTSSAYLAAAQEVSSCRRVGKGGAYSSAEDLSRPANRGSAREDARLGKAGFRLLRQLDQGE